MDSYRFFLLDAQNRIVAVEIAPCADDTQAIDVAYGWIGQHAGVEIWQGVRRVHRYLPDGAARSSRP